VAEKQRVARAVWRLVLRAAGCSCCAGFVGWGGRGCASAAGGGVPGWIVTSVVGFHGPPVKIT